MKTLEKIKHITFFFWQSPGKNETLEHKGMKTLGKSEQIKMGYFI